MSRHGRHGRHLHPHPVARPAVRNGSTPERPGSPVESRGAGRRDPMPGTTGIEDPRETAGAVDAVVLDGHAVAPALAAVALPLPEPGAAAELVEVVGATRPELQATPASRRVEPPAPSPARGPEPRPAVDQPVPAPMNGGPAGPFAATCTTAQLRRFIKSRPWVPMHELRRRFGIVGGDDDVTPIRVGDERLFIGLPPTEGRMMGDLLGGGDVGYELSLDPDAPVVVGVYPMRPIPRS